VGWCGRHGVLGDFEQHLARQRVVDELSVDGLTQNLCRLACLVIVAQ
jgi:hypothetical protein